MPEDHTTTTHTPETKGPAAGGAARPTPRRRVVRALAGLAVYLLVLSVWFSLPLGRRGVTAHIAVPASPQPRSETRQLDFELKSFCPALTIITRADSRSATVEMTLLDRSGQGLVRRWPLGEGRHQSTFSVGKGFPAGRYTLQFDGREVSGAYTVQVYGEQQPLSASGRLWLLAVVALMVTGPVHGYAWLSARQERARRGGSPVVWRAPRWARTVLLAACLVIVALPLGTLLHEGGHAIAQAAFGGWEASQSDLFGLWGEPHSIGRASDLSAWQHSIIAIAGPALPTVVAYLSLAIWVSAPGRRVRSRRAALDMFWSGLTLALLFGQLGMLLPLAGLMTDTDYSGFVQAFGSLKPVADGLLIILAAVNAVLIWIFAKHLLSLRRKTTAMAT